VENAALICREAKTQKEKQSFKISKTKFFGCLALLMHMVRHITSAAAGTPKKAGRPNESLLGLWPTAKDGIMTLELA